MKKIGITALIDFDSWDDPNYSETGGVNSVVRSILPYLIADKIVLIGMTYHKNQLLKERKIDPRISVFPIVYKSPSKLIPNRILGFFYGWRLTKILNEQQINSVYSHSEELAFWLPYSNIRYIHHLHTYVNALAVSGGSLAKIKIFQNLWEKIRIRVIKKSFKSVAVNRDVALFLESLIGSQRIIRFSNYVDLGKFSFSDPSSIRVRYDLSGKKIVLFIGRISRVKGLELFVDTVVELNQTTKNQWIGIVVGNGEYEDTIKRYIEKVDAHESVLFVGSINQAGELSRYYSLADVFLVTSWSESVPLTLLESLACGTPVVSTDVGIASDVLGYSNGHVVFGYDKGEMAKTVLKSLPYKARESILPIGQDYSIEHASRLLNNEFWSELA